MTTSRKPRVPPTPPQAPAKAAVPSAYVLPTEILVDLLKMVGALPASQAAMMFLQLQRLQPVPEAKAEE